MDLGLKNKVAFIAGSSRGIGFGIASRFLEENCKTVLTGRDDASLKQSEILLNSKFDEKNILTISADLSEQEELEKAFANTIQKWGKIDCMVINIGSGKSKTGWDISDKEWNIAFNQNFLTSVRIATQALSFMKSAMQGSIVFTASIAGLEATNAPLAYGAAKAALINYAKNLARLAAEYHVRVNCVAPGNILFPGGSWEHHLQQRQKEVQKYISTEVLQKRFGTSEEIADVVTFLSSERASFVTGACWVVDGGQIRGI